MKIRFLMAAAGVVMVAGAAQAQTPTPEGKGRLGIGVSLAPSAVITSSGGELSYLPFGLGDIFFPILLKGAKIEGEVGLLHYSSSTSQSSGPTTYTTDSKSTSLRLGFGVFKVTRLNGGSTLLYVGPRVVYISTSTSSNYSPGGTEQSTSEADWSIGAAVGGEHFLSPHFSLGGEVQLNYISFGTPDVTPSQSNMPTTDRKAVTTNGLLFIRAYF